MTTLGRCEQLRTWARRQGIELGSGPEDLSWLDEAFDQDAHEHGRDAVMQAVENDAGLFLGTVIATSVPGARWQLWPNGHPVIHLASGRDLDVVALAHDRVTTGQPRLTDVYADAASRS